MSTQPTSRGDGPILIVGGFASSAGQYEPLRAALAEVSGRPVRIAPISRLDWLGVVASDSYGALLGILDRAARAALAAHPAQRVTLVGHSAGGVLARIYLGDHPYGPRRLCYNGHRRVDALVTLGTPHTAVGEGRQGGLNQIAYVQRTYPGAYWPSLRYVSVIGRSILGAADGPPPERGAWQSYRLLGAEGAQWGDGVVPLENGLLEGSHQVVISGVCHDDRPGRAWYGSSPAIVRAWWGLGVGG
ncbi:alpha/beta fold hydrolase [Chloroflexales bacterium ZM16-3]|nr:alpha/beta fold hydrolase [Chloroflexales bacterium ZM16-3]